MKTPADKLADELRYFINRVDEGSIRSKKTYERFKKALKEFESIGESMCQHGDINPMYCKLCRKGM